MRTLVIEAGGQLIGEVDEDGTVRSEDEDIRKAAAEPAFLEQVRAGEKRLGTQAMPVEPGSDDYLDAVANVLTWYGFDMRVEDR